MGSRAEGVRGGERAVGGRQVLCGLCSYKYPLVESMETNERREPVILHQVPLLPGLQAKTLIIESLPLLQLSPEHIQLVKKEGKYQAFVMMPAAKAKELCDLKEVALGKHRVYVRRHYNGFQVFVSRLHEQLTAEDLKTTLSADFGPVAEIEILQPHEGAKNRWRHCYIRFEKDEAAEKCLFSAKKILVRGQDLHVARAYTTGQNEETDKKLFVKVLGAHDDTEEIERVLTEAFRKEGQLREKIRVDGGITNAVFTSAETADRVLATFKTGRIGKYDVVVRPWAKDNYTVFLGSIKSSVTQPELEEALSHYQPLLTCSILPSSNPTSRNGTATFGSQQAFNKILTEYKDDSKLKTVFVNQPYVTLHMNARERQEYSSFKKGKPDNSRKPQVTPALHYPTMVPMGLPQGHVMNIPNGMVMPNGMNFMPPMNMPMNMSMNMPPMNLQQMNMPMNRNFIRAHQNDI